MKTSPSKEKEFFNYKLNDLEVQDLYMLLEILVSSCELSEKEISHKINDADLIKLIKSRPNSDINCNQIPESVKLLK